MPSESNAPASLGNPQDSPLASQLPAWDLVPAHMLLVRRRSIALTKPAPRPDAPTSAPPAPSPAPVAPPRAEAPDRFCPKCGSQFEPGATFCGDCGQQVSNQTQSTLAVVLLAAGQNQIHAIQAIRNITGLGLKEAKDIVDLAPQPVKQGLTRQEAEAIRQKLIEAGATAEIR